MKKINSLLVMAVCTFAIVACLGLLSGCNKQIPYNATLYDNVGEQINADFKEANPTSGWFDSDYSLPESKIWIIETQADFTDKFTVSPFECDFENEIVVLYTFTCSQGVSTKYELSDVKENANTVTIECTFISPTKNKYANTVAKPWQRWFAIKMDKTVAKGIEITLVYK